MIAWRRWMVPLVAMMCAAHMGLSAAQAGSTPKQLSDELAAAIADIEANFQDADERFQRIALLISRATRSDPMGSALVLADVSRQVSAQSLPVVSAAAVMSAGTSSPSVLKALVEAQGDDPARTQSVRSGATNPASVLGTETAALMQPVELAPLSATPVEPVEVAAVPVPRPAPVLSVEDEPAVQTESEGLLEPFTGPPPPQPSGLPPRPPALPYRGQL